jgi:hypothetical protein
LAREGRPGLAGRHACVLRQEPREPLGARHPFCPVAALRTRVLYSQAQSVAHKAGQLGHMKVAADLAAHGR